MTIARAKRLSGFALLAGALILAVGAASPAAAFSFGKKKPAPVVVVAPPPEPEIPVGPPVLASYVVSAAGAYATYMQSASGIGDKFADGAAVQASLMQGVHSEQHQMQQGVVAYAAIVALQDPTFVAAIREFAHHASQRDAMVRNLLTNPDYVLNFAGHDSAAGLIVSTLNGQGLKLRLAGQKVRQASYDIQRLSKWSKKPVPDPMGRLEEAKQLSSTGLTAADDVKAVLMQASTGAAAMPLVGSSPAGPPYTQAVVRGMALAALAVLGQAGDDHLDYVMPLLVNDGDAFCFNMAKLNLYQCLSVARPYYEDVYCLGLHAMMDTGQCVMTSVGEPPPVAPIVPSVVTAVAPVTAAAAATSTASASPSTLPVATTQ